MEWQHVDSILQLVANGTTLPHLNLPVQIGVKSVGNKCLRKVKHYNGPHTY